MASIRSYMESFFEYLDENPGESASFFSFICGMLFLMLVLKETDTFIKDLAFVLGIVFIIYGLFTGFNIVLLKKFHIHTLTNKITVIIEITLGVILFTQLNAVTYNSVSYILILIIIIYSLRSILYSFYVFSARNYTKKSEEDKRYNAAFGSFYMILFALLIFSGIDILYFKLLILFLVYGIYYLIRQKYLIKYIKSDIKPNITYKRTIFSEVWNVNHLILYSLVVIFLLFYFNVLSIFGTQSILYFYSTTAQVFATLLGIIVMFSILILQKNDEKQGNRNRFLKRGLVGFTILYILIIFFSTMGVVINEIDHSNSIEKLPENSVRNDLKVLLSVFFFEFIILMIPVGLLYLYAMISDFLQWDATFEIKEGQSIISEYLKSTEGADRVKVEVKER